MSETLVNFVEAINLAHKAGLQDNNKSYIIGLGVNYQNGADGTTKNLSSIYPDKVLDVPVSEAAFTGMCVGMATAGLNPIVHHGRVEFALLAMDQILTQAAKWNYMFGGDYPCKFGARLNIGRQWGNGPQHTSSYNSLFVNTPGLNVLWPSRPSEAYTFTKALHHAPSPTIMMEHRYLFQTKDSFNENNNDPLVIPQVSFYGKSSKTIILTYGDGLVEAIKTKNKINDSDIQIICINAFVRDRELHEDIIKAIESCDNLICLDTSNYQFGLMQGLIGSLAEKINLKEKIKIFSPPFIPCATSPKLVKNYYPFSPDVINYLNEINVTKERASDYLFDDINLPANIDFSENIPSKIIKSTLTE